MKGEHMAKYPAYPYKPKEERLYAEKVKKKAKEKGITLIEVCQLYNERTGKATKKQNFWNRLNRENFPVEDVKIIADILGCDLNIELIDKKKRTNRSPLFLFSHGIHPEIPSYRRNHHFFSSM